MKRKDEIKQFYRPVKYSFIMEIVAVAVLATIQIIYSPPYFIVVMYAILIIWTISNQLLNNRCYKKAGEYIESKKV